MNTSTLINILQFSIVNYEIVRKFFVQHQYQQNEDEIDDQYFTDRQYRRKRSFNRRENFRDRDDKFQTRRSKKCFVCEKVDCCSSNHSEKKRKNSKKRFSDRHFEYKIRQEFDRRLNQYIADYESDSEDEYVTQYFDELAISSAFETDVKLIEFKSDELFLTSFGEQNIEFINSSLAIFLTSSLVDKAFQHRLISKNIINSFVNICKTGNQLRTAGAGSRRSASSVVSASVSAEWNEKTSVNRQQSNDQFLIALKNFLESSSNTSIFLHTALSSILIVLKKTRVSSRTIIRTSLCFVLFLMLMSLQRILSLMSLMSLMSI
jgi:hypothetical protein